jgi:MvaI/BcnI restriction endonuclease family protein
MNELLNYAADLVRASGNTLRTGEVFAKVLSPNDDSGRHGVLVPTDVYAFFPALKIADKTQNVTCDFPAIDVLSGKESNLAYKYYQRYPERRITRLNGIINDRTKDPRLIVFLRAHHTDGTTAYYVDCITSAPGGRFAAIFGLVFGDEASPEAGIFVVRPIDSEAFSADKNLSELLAEFDKVNRLGWVESLREGDTGIGYTFETLLGITENNDKRADFKGIEIKCKGVKEGVKAASGKINLFQHGPVWLGTQSARDRIRVLGKAGADGLYACHSQVRTTRNNLGLSLDIVEAKNKIDLLKSADTLGYWTFDTLEERLAEKHSRAVMIKARSRQRKSSVVFHYEELTYLERPSIGRFVALVRNRNIVFEFLMSEKPDGTVRNHGYPWRLIREEFLDQLFSFQIRLR